MLRETEQERGGEGREGGRGRREENKRGLRHQKRKRSRISRIQRERDRARARARARQAESEEGGERDLALHTTMQLCRLLHNLLRTCVCWGRRKSARDFFSVLQCEWRPVRAGIDFYLRNKLRQAHLQTRAKE